MVHFARPQDGGREVFMVHRVGEVLGLQAHGVGGAVDGAALATALRQPAGGVELHPLQGGGHLQDDARSVAPKLCRRSFSAVQDKVVVIAPAAT